MTVDHQVVANKLVDLKADFNVFSIQEISSRPDTIARFVAYNPKLEGYNINIGGVYNKLSQSKIYGIVTGKKGRKPI